MVGGTEPTLRRSPRSVDVGGEAEQKRCIPIPRQIGVKPEPACTQFLGDDLGTRAIYPSQQKMTKRQWTGKRPMVVGLLRANFGPKVETNLYIKGA